MTRRLAVAALPAFLLAALPAIAQQPPESPPAMAVSPGGIRFVHAQRPSMPSQAVVFAFKDGLGFTQAGKVAVGAVGATLVLEGTATMSQSELGEEMNDLQAGARLVSISDYTLGILLAPAKNAEKAADLLGGVLKAPAFPQIKLADLLAKSRAGAVSTGQNPVTIARRLLITTFYPPGDRVAFHRGDPAIYDGVTRDDIVAWHKRVLHREGLVAAAVGPLDTAAAGGLIDKVFGGLPATAPPIQADPLDYRRSAKLIVLERPGPQTIIAAGSPTDLVSTENDPRAPLAVELFGNGAGSRLYAALRERLGAAYDVSAGIVWSERRRGHLTIVTSVAHDRAADAVKAIREEYERFVAEGPADADVASITRTYAGGLAERVRQPIPAAALLVDLVLQNLPLDYFMTGPETVRAIGGAAVRDLVKEKLPKPPLAFVLVAPSASAIEAAGLKPDCVIKAPEEITGCL